MNHVFTDDVILRDIVREALTSYLNGSTGLDDAVSAAANRKMCIRDSTLRNAKAFLFLNAYLIVLFMPYRQRDSKWLS